MTGQHNNVHGTLPFVIDVFPALINPSFIDPQMTEKIKAHISARCAVPLNIDDSIDDSCTDNWLAFERLCLEYDELNACDDVHNPYQVVDSTVKSVLSMFNIQSRKSCLAFQLQDEDHIQGSCRSTGKKYLVCAFSHTILIFFDPRNKPYHFLCALYPEALTFSFSTQLVKRETVVWETSREPIEYYDKFNPVPDCRIVSRTWRRTNRDGSRSFAGGLKPENNPLQLELEYGVITITMCGTTKLEAGFSNGTLAHLFANNYGAYLESKGCPLRSGSIQQNQYYEEALALIKTLNAPENRSMKEWFRSLNTGLKVLVIVAGCIIAMLVLRFWLDILGRFFG